LPAGIPTGLNFCNLVVILADMPPSAPWGNGVVPDFSIRIGKF